MEPNEKFAGTRDYHQNEEKYQLLRLRPRFVQNYVLPLEPQHYAEQERTRFQERIEPKDIYQCHQEQIQQLQQCQLEENEQQVLGRTGASVRPLESAPITNASALTNAIVNLVSQTVSNFSHGAHAIDFSTVANVALQEYLKIQAERQGNSIGGDPPRTVFPDSQSLDASHQAQVWTPFCSEGLANHRTRPTETNVVSNQPNGPLHANLSNVPFSPCGVNPDSTGATSRYPTNRRYSSQKLGVDNSKNTPQLVGHPNAVEAEKYPLQMSAPRVLPHRFENMPQQFPSKYTEFENYNQHFVQPRYPKLNLKPIKPKQPNEYNGVISVQGNLRNLPSLERADTVLTSNVCRTSAAEAKHRFAAPAIQPEKERRLFQTARPEDFLKIVISAILEHPHANTVTYYDICDEVYRHRGNIMDEVHPDWREKIRELLATSPAFVRKKVSKYVYWSVAPDFLTQATALCFPKKNFHYIHQPETAPNSGQSKQKFNNHSSQTVHSSSPISEKGSTILNLGEDLNTSASPSCRMSDDNRTTPRKAAFTFPNHDENNKIAINISPTFCNPAVPLSRVKGTSFHDSIQLENSNGEAMVRANSTGCLTSIEIAHDVESTVPEAEEAPTCELISFPSTTTPPPFESASNKESRETIPMNDISLSRPEPSIASNARKHYIDLSAITAPKVALARNPDLFGFCKEKPVTVARNPDAFKPAPKKKAQTGPISTVDPEVYQKLLFDNERLESALKTTNERNSELISELHLTRTEFEKREKLHCSEIAERDFKLCIVSDAIKDLVNRYPVDVLKAVSSNVWERAKREGVLEERNRLALEDLREIATIKEEASPKSGSDMPMKRKRSPENCNKE